MLDQVQQTQQQDSEIEYRGIGLEIFLSWLEGKTYQPQIHLYHRQGNTILGQTLVHNNQSFQRGYNGY